MGADLVSIRVGVADDDPLVRRLLAQIINRQDGMHVEWTARSGTDVVNLLIGPAERMVPCDVDVLILDINMPGLSGADTAAAVHEAYPDLSIIMLTALERVENVRAMLASGALGLLHKDDEEDQLVAAVRAAYRGVAVFSAEIVCRFAQDLRASPVATESISPLRPREAEILELVSHSLTNRQIGRRLGISEATVKFQISAIISKLGCSDRVGMVRWGFQQGLIH